MVRFFFGLDTRGPIIDTWKQSASSPSPLNYELKRVRGRETIRLCEVQFYKTSKSRVLLDEKLGQFSPTHFLNHPAILVILSSGKLLDNNLFKTSWKVFSSGFKFVESVTVFKPPEQKYISIFQQPTLVQTLTNPNVRGCLSWKSSRLRVENRHRTLLFVLIFLHHQISKRKLAQLSWVRDF